MHWKVFSAAAAALCVVAIADMPAATAAGRDATARLTQSAYFSDACRQEAQALGVASTSDANELLTAFAAVARQRRRRRRPGRHEKCRPGLQRLQGAGGAVDQSAAAQWRRCRACIHFDVARFGEIDGASLGKIDRIVVFVPGLDRYVDPAMPMDKQAVLDRIIVERATRAHLLGPPLAGAAHGGCPDTCMLVLPPRSQSAVRVKTETIRP